MPQMSPLSWLALFLVFTFTFILFNIMNYFSFIYKTKMSSHSLNKISKNWKW